MIQFFRFDKDLISENKFSILSGSTATKFFVKKILLFFVLIYSIFFIPVALPFVQIPFVPAYFIIAFVSIVYFFRLINYIVKFLDYQAGSITVKKESIIIVSKSANITIPSDSITFIEHNILGNLVIRTGKTAAFVFPIMLINTADKTTLLGMFGDLSPKRTIINKKIWEFLDAIGVALFLAVHIIQFVVQAYFIPTGSMEDTLLVGDHLFVEKITYGPVIPKMVGMAKPIHLKRLSIRDIKRGDIVIFKPPREVSEVEIETAFNKAYKIDDKVRKANDKANKEGKVFQEDKFIGELKDEFIDRNYVRKGHKVFGEEDKDYIKRCIAIPGDDITIKDGFVYINNVRLTEPYVKGRTFDDFETSKVQGIVPEGQVVVFGDNRENSMDGRYFGYLDIEKIRGRAFILYWNTNQIRQFNFSRLGLIY
jgi:signal peptidase I